MRKSKSKLLNVVRKMPPLYHTLPGEKFDIRKSMVILWLVKQPDVLNFLWNHIKCSDNVFYDSEKGTWRGIDFYD